MGCIFYSHFCLPHTAVYPTLNLCMPIQSIEMYIIPSPRIYSCNTEHERKLSLENMFLLLFFEQH